MVEIKESLLETLLEQAITRAYTCQADQLVSMTQQIDEIHPIDYFEASKTLGYDRVFWSSTAEDFYIAGSGSALEISTEKSCFKSIEEQWQALLEKAIIFNPYQVPGTGILALGGMSFDPAQGKTALWDKYPSSQLIIPRYMLTKNEGKYYFTVTLQVSKGDDISALTCEIDKQIEVLLHSEVQLPAGTSVIKKEELMVDQWMKVVKQAITAIQRNEAKKIVLAREMRLTLNKPAEISVILHKLLEMQSNSYIFAVEREGDCFVGATPERLVKLSGSRLLSACVAGTAPRGKTVSEDKQLSQSLLHDDKNREEHGYVVEMIRQAMGKYCKNIDIPSQPIVYPLKNLQHLYTPVAATLKNNHSIFDVIKQLHPTPALGGVPRNESLAFINEYEAVDRGWYGAPIGWLDSNHCAEFAVGIRSGLIQGDKVSLFAGCGIMKDSDPVLEYEETNIKFLPILSVLEEHYESH